LSWRQFLRSALILSFFRKVSPFLPACSPPPERASRRQSRLPISAPGMSNVTFLPPPFFPTQQASIFFRSQPPLPPVGSAVSYFQIDPSFFLFPSPFRELSSKCWRVLPFRWSFPPFSLLSSPFFFFFCFFRPKAFIPDSLQSLPHPSLREPLWLFWCPPFSPPFFSHGSTVPTTPFLNLFFSLSILIVPFAFFFFPKRRRASPFPFAPLHLESTDPDVSPGPRLRHPVSPFFLAPRLSVPSCSLSGSPTPLS